MPLEADAHGFNDHVAEQNEPTQEAQETQEFNDMGMEQGAPELGALEEDDLEDDQGDFAPELEEMEEDVQGDFRNR